MRLYGRVIEQDGAVYFWPAARLDGRCPELRAVPEVLEAGEVLQLERGEELDRITVLAETAVRHGLVRQRGSAARHGAGDVRSLSFSAP
jgi:hypothetical protein